jgi:trk system potassium uptake protein TrkA
MARSDASQELAVIGLGQFGISLAQNLVRLGHTVLAIDRDRDLVQDWADDLTQTVALDATDEAALRAVGIDAFDTVVVAIGADFESSVMITMLLKELGVRRVVCKALSQRQKEVLRRVGADEVVQPEYEAGLRLAQRLSAPDLIDRLELGPGMNLTQLRAPASLVGRSLRDLDLTGRFSVSVLLMRGDRLRVVPRADEVVQPDDMLLLLGSDEDIARLESWEG